MVFLKYSKGKCNSWIKLIQKCKLSRYDFKRGVFFWKLRKPLLEGLNPHVTYFVNSKWYTLIGNRAQDHMLTLVLYLDPQDEASWLQWCTKKKKPKSSNLYDKYWFYLLTAYLYQEFPSFYYWTSVFHLEIRLNGQLCHYILPHCNIFCLVSSGPWSLG